jgi:hypothetical protein
VGHEQVLAHAEAALLLEVAGDELRRLRRHRRAQHEQLPGPQHREEVVEHGADRAHVDLDVREARRAEREHDRVGGRRVRGALGEAELHPREQLVGARLLERHVPRPQRGEAVGVAVDPQHAQARVGEGEREREAHPAQSDHRDVGRHGAPG